MRTFPQFENFRRSMWLLELLSLEFPQEFREIGLASRILECPNISDVPWWAFLWTSLPDSRRPYSNYWDNRPSSQIAMDYCQSWLAYLPQVHFRMSSGADCPWPLSACQFCTFESTLAGLLLPACLLNFAPILILEGLRDSFSTFRIGEGWTWPGLWNFGLTPFPPQSVII